MKTKNLLVSLLVVVSMLLLANTVSAASNSYSVSASIDDIYAPYASVTAGDTIQVKTWVIARFDDTDFDRDVTVEVKLDTGKEEARAISEPMVVEAGDIKKVVLNLKVPYELEDELSHKAVLTIEVNGKEHDFTKTYEINVERPTYSSEIKSVTVSQSIKAGENLPIDVVLKNTGYLKLKDIYVTARISALNLEQTTYFGDMVPIDCNSNDCDEDDEDSASGKLTLEIPYNAKAGVYTLEIEASNEDVSNKVVKQIVIENDFPNSVVVPSDKKTVNVGEEAEYELLIVNPTNNVKVYRVVAQKNSDALTTNGDITVAIPAGSSKVVKIIASANSEGEYNFNVNVFSGEELVQEVTLSLEAQGKQTADLTLVLTIILAIIAIVLIVVLVVLTSKKPAKEEEFGESYY